MNTSNSVAETDTNLQPSSTLPAALAALDDFLVIRPQAVARILRQLADQKDTLDISFGRRGGRIVTRVLAVNESEGTFFYAYGDSDDENAQLQASGENLFSCTEAGAFIQFVCGQPEAQTYEGVPAFKSTFPESLYRMQRRQHVRVTTPTANPYVCTVTLPNQKRISFDVVDLSLSGVRLRSTNASIGELSVDMVLTGATFDYQDMGTMETDLKITFIHSSQNFNNPIYNFGCRFLDLPKTQEEDLQRLITVLSERQHPA
ncbi:flagellar brake protein [Glaciimonas sp. PCH181]|uniref:flagellar brake protein n=1 Tax=Glaciimonas sp. PCH181 TaxID=2133943 RepID=UPI000D33A146|nr:flagellar brake protein [Glaciimonas sp. PCH181]PUA16355.1 hypothetical protein C7W93_23870 [Glaciimonas sp. PCH181]